jgi:hypothetical protein
LRVAGAGNEPTVSGCYRGLINGCIYRLRLRRRLAESDILFGGGGSKRLHNLMSKVLISFSPPVVKERKKWTRHPATKVVPVKKRYKRQEKRKVINDQLGVVEKRVDL